MSRSESLNNTDFSCYCKLQLEQCLAHYMTCLRSGLGGGLFACSTLAALKQPITAFLDLQPEVQQHANPYWWVRVALTPLVLLNMTISGILQVCALLAAQSMYSIWPQISQCLSMHVHIPGLDLPCREFALHVCICALVYFVHQKTHICALHKKLGTRWLAERMAAGHT